LVDEVFPACVYTVALASGWGVRGGVLIFNLCKKSINPWITQALLVGIRECAKHLFCNTS
uniref:hypothetical protein n=1 Tax=uncultured Nostoc sp. TaxID=340711 RepID=UPI0035C9ECD7